MVASVEKIKSKGQSQSRQGLLSLTIKDQNALYDAYMPYVINGGLFITTNRPYKLGDVVIMSLNLMDEMDRLPVSGKVVWLTPGGAAGGYRSTGVGIQFDDDSVSVRTKIETHLAGKLQSERRTHTM